MSATVQVQIALTVTVDTDLWDEEYGTGTTAEAVRADVRRYVASSVHELAGFQAANGRVVLRAEAAA